MRRPVLLHQRFRLRDRLGVAAAIDRVGLDQVLLGRGRRFRRVVDRRNGTGRDAGATIDALLGVDVQHRGGLELGLVLPRVDAVHGADVDAGSILRVNARIGDNESHCAELSKGADKGQILDGAARDAITTV